MFGYIYKTTNLLDGRIYVGKKHKPIFIESYFGSGVLITRAIGKYGVENFKVEQIDSADSLEELNEKEKYWIKKLKSQTTYGNYNIAEGGFGGNIFTYLPDDRKKQFIERCKINTKGKNNPNYGNGNKIRGDKNPSRRPEVREKLRKTSSGVNNGMYGVVGEKHHRYGKKHNVETRNKIKESLKNTFYSKVCKNCNKEFDTKSPRRMYCNDKCKRQYRDNNKQ